MFIELRIFYVGTCCSTCADNPGKPTGGHRTSHRSPTGGHRGGHDTFCGGQGWTTGGHRWGKISCCIQNIAKIVTRTCISFVDPPAFTSALSAFVICLFCYIYSAALPTSRLAYTRCQNSFNCCRTS